MIIYGDQNVSYPDHLNFGKYMLDNLRSAKCDEICIENGHTKEKLTYKEFTQYAVNLSVALSKLGVRKGDVVAIGSDPFLHFLPTALAVVFTGATYTAYDEVIGRAVLEHKINLVKPSVFICSLSFWQTYSELLKKFDCIRTYIALDDIPGLTSSCRSLALEEQDLESFEPAAVDGRTDTAVILYSSGTTGMPKGVEITHFSCIATSSPAAFKNMTSLKTAFMAYSWTGNYFLFMTFKFLLLGRKVVFTCTSKKSVNVLLPIIRDCKVDIVFSNPVRIRKIAENVSPEEDYFDSVKMIYCRSFPLQLQTIKQLKERFPKVPDIIQAFGLTECGEPFSQIWGKFKAGSVGQVSPGIIAKIVDPETRALLGPNQNGEICVKGLTIMKGYLNIDRINYLDDDGFYKTGDLGYYDEEEHFFIVDRLTDIINYAGFKISPVELENVLLQHSAVLDVGVVGRPERQDSEYELPTAFVVKKPGHDISEKELIEFVASEVSPHMRLTGGLMFITKVPRNPRGKTLRRKLREMLSEKNPLLHSC